jgi:miniconductance mechanosensitive channel
MTELITFRDWLENYPWLYQLLAVSAIIVAAIFANWLTKRVLLRGLERLLRAIPAAHGEAPMKPRVIKRVANVVPAIVLMWGVTAVPGLPEWLVAVVRNVCGAFIVLTLALAFSAVLDLVNDIYTRRPKAQNHPIKGYLQLVKIVIFAIAAILMIATLIDRSPLILLSGLGAMAAVLMLVFQDTLLSLVASVQISSSDMVRVGDWIEMPQLNADGFVMDIALHTVTVQNWDKTITTLPTKRLITDPFKNWRGMQESGGRRIKRSLLLDQNSVRYLDEGERRSLYRFLLLNDYLGEKERELAEWNAQLGTPDEVNQRRMTNFGTFRIYVERYLRNHPGINQDMYVLVRQLAPGPDGIPLELYCFTRSVAWADYEGVQADIFDHLLAILPAFGLRVFQQPSGADFQRLVGGVQASAAPRSAARSEAT